MKNITFIVGAGASSEFGMPTGKSLLQIVSSFVRWQKDQDSSRHVMDENLRNAFMKTGLFEDSYFDVAQKANWLSKIALMAPSIDNLLHSHKENSTIEKIGKLFICKTILEAEGTSFLANKSNGRGYLEHFDLFQSHSHVGKYISDKWLGKLFSLLVEMRDFDAFLSILQKVNFLCFNYDRCIEQGITSLAMRYFNLSDEQARHVLSKLNVIHIYGSLGELKVNNGSIYGYGDTSIDIADIFDGISTFTDEKRRQEVRASVKSTLEGSEIAVFLGYGFLEINNQLFFDNGYFDLKRVFGTVKGLSPNSVNTIRSDIESTFLFGSDNVAARQAMLAGGRPDMVVLSDLCCSELIDYHSVYLRRELARS